MLGFLYRLIFGSFTSCKHYWEIIRTVKIFDGDDTNPEKRPIAMDYHSQCKNCGKLKKNNF